MRTKRTVINIVTSLIYQILVLLVGFYVPRLIIQTYGSRINGLNSTISQILNIINFLQAGLVGASIYEMYSQIANNDNDGEASIYYASKHHFDRLSSYFFFELELLVQGCTSYSQRVFDALIYDKKVITDNLALKDEEFYDPNQILIFDDINKISLSFFEIGFESKRHYAEKLSPIKFLEYLSQRYDMR